MEQFSVHDPIAEHLTFGENLRRSDIDRFRAEGVPGFALAHTGIVLRHRVVFDGCRFEFERHRGSEDAVAAFVVPAHNIDGEIADLIAWRPPNAPASWLGRVGLLGEDQVLGPRLGPLVVHDTVLDWLRADREGVVVVDMRWAATLLRDAGTLIVSSIEHGQRLRKSLTYPAPKILVNTAEGAAA